MRRDLAKTFGAPRALCRRLNSSCPSFAECVMRERDRFSQCLVDGDQQSLDRARLVRQKALLISIIFESALVAALLLWPLITQGLPPQQFLITPAPPYHGGPSSSSGGSHSSSPRLPTKTSTAQYPAMSQPT